MQTSPWWRWFTRGEHWLSLLGSESCPLVSEPWGVGVLCVGEVVAGDSCPLVSGPSPGWAPPARPAEASGCSAGGDGCLGERCLLSSTAFPTAERPRTGIHQAFLEPPAPGTTSCLEPPAPGTPPAPPANPQEPELQFLYLLIIQHIISRRKTLKIKTGKYQFQGKKR